MHNEVQECAELLAELIGEDPDYRAFLALTEEIKQNPELSQRVHAFRKRNYELQNDSQNPEQEMWDMTQEYRELMRIPLAGAYFEAEAGVCRMLQEIMGCMCANLRFPEL